MSGQSDQLGEIRYAVGDATAPRGEGPKVIAHVCNDVGRWGRGFVMAVSRRWPGPREQFLAWHRGDAKDTPPFELGQVQFVRVEPALWVANLVGQHGLRPVKGVPPVRYEAIERGLIDVAAFAEEHGASVHMPRIGCGLAGGTWDRIEPLLRQILCRQGVHVTIYDLPTVGEDAT